MIYGGTITQALDILQRSGSNIKRAALSAVAEEPSAWVIVREGVVFLCLPVTAGIYSGHIYAPPEVRGRQAIRAERQAAEWLLTTTGARAIMGLIPVGQKHIARHHALAGFERVVGWPERSGMTLWVYPGGV